MLHSPIIDAATDQFFAAVSKAKIDPSLRPFAVGKKNAIDVVSLLFRCCCNQRLLIKKLLSSIADAPAADRSTAVVAATVVVADAADPEL